MAGTAKDTTGTQDEVETGGKKGYKSLGPKLALLNKIHKNHTKPVKVMLPKDHLITGDEKKEVTPIPKITEKNIKEIEIGTVKEPYSYVRIIYDTISSEYIYEVIEPPTLGG